MPALRRIQVIHVEDETCLDLIGAYGSSVEAFLLDSGRPSRAELGGTGRTHDWSLSAAFVRRSPVPVFLAGGLTPKNVADALAQVRPFGIDVCTGVRTGGRLDPAKLASFIAAMGDPV
jgi:phosphoribosylanthranilate isomerase